MSDQEPSVDLQPAPIGRRAAVKTWLGVAIVLAIPLAAMIATAEPIPNPPSRRTLFAVPTEAAAPAPPGDEGGKAEKRAKKRDESDTAGGRADRPDRRDAASPQAGAP